MHKCISLNAKSSILMQIATPLQYEPSVATSLIYYKINIFNRKSGFLIANQDS